MANENTTTKDRAMKPLTKAKMITRIRTMQEDMGIEPVKAKTLRVEFSEDEVREIYERTSDLYKIRTYEEFCSETNQ